ncbi:hypothetical protein CEXT_23161 [Caerostris extrusa]|uniref:Uncharacterized protein n=1 Tax=Caerostris extrusa TaxID=172846 RepID=A0AAV4WET9_CAEEX|nr:hypothetical protein CEXT_23161 [Caerostris extrusa]
MTNPCERQSLVPAPSTHMYLTSQGTGAEIIVESHQYKSHVYHSVNHSQPDRFNVHETHTHNTDFNHPVARIEITVNSNVKVSLKHSMGMNSPYRDLVL